jgi:thiol-disulfide isomerase/thioredoxin
LREGLGAVGAELGEKATLVQFSTAFCAPCRATRLVLGGVADIVPGVAHVEVDAEAHLALVRQLKIRRTPTVLVLDADGHEVRRASGAPPSRAAVLATLATFMAVPGESVVTGIPPMPPARGEWVMGRSPGRSIRGIATAGPSTHFRR